MYWRVKNWGGALTYSGPQQPAVIGASIASAKIHLSDEIYILQNSLAEKIKFCNEILEHYELPLVSKSPSPIFFIGLGLTKVGYNMVRRLSDEGYYVNLGIFPAVPETCTGIRFTITNHHTLEDIEALAERIHFHLPKALNEEDRSMKDVYRAFKPLAKLQEKSKSDLNVKTKFNLQHETTIKAIPEQLWDDLLGDNGSFTWNGLALLEESFKDNTKPEDNWEFHYYIIRDQSDQPVIATFFTSLLTKDDMLAPLDISKKIEQMRVNDPYYLTSKTFMMGSLLTDGDHLYVNKSYPKWKEALILLLDTAWVEQEKQNAGMIYLRDFPSKDMEMKSFLIDQGFIKMDIPDTHIIDSSPYYSMEDYFVSLPYKKRSHIKQDVLKYESLFDIKIATDASDDEIKHWYNLYKNVKNKNLDVNTFVLPEKLFHNIAKSRYWDIISINFKPGNDHRKEKLPIAVGFSHRNHNYSPLIMGIDYNYQEYKIYKQMLYQFISRALELKAKKVFLGLTTSLEKRKLGAVPMSKVAFVQIKDHYNMSLIGMMPNTKSEVNF